MISGKQTLIAVNRGLEDQFKTELKNNFVANIALGSIFDNVSKENARLLKQVDELEVA